MVSRANARFGDPEIRGHAARLAVGAAIDRVDRAGQRLRVALHFRCELADLCRVREVAALVRHDADRDRHQRDAMQLPAPILAEEIARATVLLRILKRNQHVEDVDDLRADLVDRLQSA